MNKLFCSVVVPTYNRGYLITKTIESILQQTFTNFELIIVDDGSTDNTTEIVKIYIDNTKTRYFLITNGERGAARNFGFKEALGEYVFFIDSDDLMLPNHLEVVYNGIMEATPKPNFVHTWFDFIDEQNSFVRIGSREKQNYVGMETVLKGNPFGCLVAVKKNNPNLILFEENRDFAIMEDWIFFVQNLRNDKMLILHQCTINMLDHDRRSMANNLLIIKKLQLAKNHILQTIPLNIKETKILNGYNLLSVATHYYIENNRVQSLKYLSKSIKYLGILPLTINRFIKYNIGKRTIEIIKNKISNK